MCAAATSSHLEVSAKTIQSDLKKGQTILSGEVMIIKGEDKLWADEVVIQTDKKNQPLTYTAIGNVRFYTKMPDKKIKEKKKRAVYDVQKDEYQLFNNAMIEEVGKSNAIRGNIITLNPTTQEASVKGSNQKPSVLTFIMEDDKKE